MRKLAIVLIVIAAILLLGCAQKQVQTSAPKPESQPTEVKEVTQIEESINDVENVLNQLQDLDNVSFNI